MRSDSTVSPSSSNLDAAGFLIHDSRESWIPRRASTRDTGIARYWINRRREAVYGRLGRLATLARTQH
jgi:hypothetical protein